MPNLVDTAWLLAEAGYWHEASAAAYTCRDLYTDERVLLGGAARLVANEKLGRTKLHHACLVGNLSRVQALLDCGLPSRIHSADRNAMTMDYRALDGTYHSSVTPLELAISGGHAEIARELFRCGAKPDLVQRLRPFRYRYGRVHNEEEERIEREALIVSKTLFCELLRASNVAAGIALKKALKVNIPEVVRENLMAGAIENKWTLPRADNEGTSFNVIFEQDGKIGLRFYEGSLVSSTIAGMPAHERGIRLFDTVTHVSGVAVASMETSEILALIKAARSIATPLTLTIARPAAKELESLLMETKEGEELRDIVFYLQQDSSSEAVLRELATLPHNVVDALVINRELGCEAWVRELWTDANLSNAVSRDNCFHSAVCIGAVDLVQDCISRGVDVNSSNSGPSYLDMAIIKAAEKGHVAIVALLCRSPEIDIDTALMSASKCGLIVEAEEMCARGADVDFFNDFAVENPLYASASKGHTEIVQILCEYGAHVGLMGDPDRLICPLDAACKHDHAPAAGLLIKAGASVKEGALYIAIENGSIACFDLLCKKGAKVNARIPQIRRNHWTWHSHIASLEVKDGDPRSFSIRPLGLACVCGRANFASELLRRGAKVNYADAGGRTALMGACLEGHEDVLRVLLSFSSEKDELDVNMRDSTGRSALSWACKMRHTGCVRLLLERTDLDPMSRDERGFNAADLALGHRDILELLRARGVEPS